MATDYVSLITDKLLGINFLRLSDRDKITFEKIRQSFYMAHADEYFSHKGKTPCYELKSFIFNNYAYALKCVRKYQYWLYLENPALYGSCTGDLEKFVSSLDDKERLLWQEYIITAQRIEFMHPVMYEEMIRIINADKRRRQRLKKRISNILLKGNAYFLTLTFNDNLLASTQPQTRREYVHRLCKSISNDFVGNIDFGKKNDREHYHVVISTDSFNDCEYKYIKGVGYSSNYSSSIDEIWSSRGFYFIRQCGNSDSDSDALAKYTTKLVNHAVKETTKRNVLIYSR